MESAMTDRELLELAAKAAGLGELDFDYVTNEGFPFYRGPRLPMTTGVIMAAMHTYWNPLDNDGDALRLAVDLGLRVYPVARTLSGAACSAVGSCTGERLSEVVDASVDTRTATRRAIVRAAAAIGSAMDGR